MLGAVEAGEQTGKGREGKGTERKVWRKCEIRWLVRLRESLRSVPRRDQSRGIVRGAEGPRRKVRLRGGIGMLMGVGSGSRRRLVAGGATYCPR